MKWIFQPLVSFNILNNLDLKFTCLICYGDYSCSSDIFTISTDRDTCSRGGNNLICDGQVTCKILSCTEGKFYPCGM